jgi:hypothetical protein
MQETTPSMLPKVAKKNFNIWRLQAFPILPKALSINPSQNKVLATPLGWAIQTFLSSFDYSF